MQDFKNTTISAESNGETVSISVKGTQQNLVGILCDTIHVIAQQLNMSDMQFLENVVRIMVGDQLINSETE